MRSGTVLITGASSGIGEATALHLKRLGFDAVGGVRKDEDAERLRTSGVRAVKLEVTDPQSIAAVRDELGAGPLAALVNNAGIAVAGPLEFLPIEELRRQLEVNVIGQVAVTQALLPALRAGRGRIVNVSSIGGRVALPLVGAYNISKFALEAFSDALRRELLRQDVDVIVIEPGGIKTPIWRKSGEAADAMLDATPPELDRLYGRMIAAVRAETAKIANERGEPASAVAEVIGKALTARRPRARYVVGRDAKRRATAARILPDRLMDRAIGRVLGG